MKKYIVSLFILTKWYILFGVGIEWQKVDSLLNRTMGDIDLVNYILPQWADNPYYCPSELSIYKFPSTLGNMTFYLYEEPIGIDHPSGYFVIEDCGYQTCSSNINLVQRIVNYNISNSDNNKIDLLKTIISLCPPSTMYVNDSSSTYVFDKRTYGKLYSRLKTESERTSYIFSCKHPKHFDSKYITDNNILKIKRANTHLKEIEDWMRSVFGRSHPYEIYEQMPHRRNYKLYYCIFNKNNEAALCFVLKSKNHSTIYFFSSTFGTDIMLNAMRDIINSSQIKNNHKLDLIGNLLNFYLDIECESSTMAAPFQP